MNFAPCNNYVIVKKIAAASTSSGGIILTTSQEATQCVAVAKAPMVGIDIGAKLIIRWSGAMQIDGDFYAVDYKDIITEVL